MMPALVVPDVATTAASDDGSPSASIAARSAEPVSRWSPVCTVSGSISRIRSVLTMEEGASALTAARHRRPPPAPPPLTLDSPRAPSRPSQFAAAPTVTYHQPNVAGDPARQSFRL